VGCASRLGGKRWRLTARTPLGEHATVWGTRNAVILQVPLGSPRSALLEHAPLVLDRTRAFRQAVRCYGRGWARRVLRGRSRLRRTLYPLPLFTAKLKARACLGFVWVSDSSSSGPACLPSHSPNFTSYTPSSSARRAARARSPAATILAANSRRQCRDQDMYAKKSSGMAKAQDEGPEDQLLRPRLHRAVLFLLSATA
jgi:hypothetical protein